MNSSYQIRARVFTGRQNYVQNVAHKLLVQSYKFGVGFVTQFRIIFATDQFRAIFVTPGPVEIITTPVIYTAPFPQF